VVGPSDRVSRSAASYSTISIQLCADQSKGVTTFFMLSASLSYSSSTSCSRGDRSSGPGPAKDRVLVRVASVRSAMMRCFGGF
jgi:hypothetical protein